MFRNRYALLRQETMKYVILDLQVINGKVYLGVGFIIIIDFININRILMSSKTDNSQIPVWADRVKQNKLSLHSI